MDAPAGAGRRTSARGRHRRGLLVEAAAALLLQEGFAGVTHRTVARRAELPLASTTYYFASLEDLLEQAVRHLAEGWLVGARAAVDALPAELDSRQVADALLHVGALGPAGGTRGDPVLLRSLYERYVEAARHPSLRPVIAAYDAQIERLLSEVLTRRREAPDRPPAALVLAVLDGATLRALAEGTDPAAAAAVLQQLLDGFRPASPTAP